MNLFLGLVGVVFIILGIVTIVMKKSFKYLFIVVGLVIVILANSFTIIPTGYTGVKVTFGQIDKTTLPNGFNGHIPVIQSIYTVNNKQQDIVFTEDTISSETSERNEVFFSGITVTYQINPEKSAWIYANVSDYQNGLVSKSLVASAIKTSSKTLTPIDVTNRSILEPKAKEEVQRSLDEKYGENTVLNKVVIENATFDNDYNQKIAAKQQAQMDYETQQIDNKKNVEKAQADATVKKTNAEADAEAKRIAAKAEADANREINNSINENILKSKYYEKWDGKLPSTILSNDNNADILIEP